MARQQETSSKKAVVSAITKAKNVCKRRNSVLQKFNALGAFLWLNMETMEKNKYYRITDVKKVTSKFGERLLVELDGRAKLYLPERYNTFSDRQLNQIGKCKYSLINNGKEGKIFKLKLVEADVPSYPIPGTSTAGDTIPAAPAYSLNIPESGARPEPGAKNVTKSKNSILQKFNALGAFLWLNMETMEKNKYYRITDVKKVMSKFGERLLVELHGRAKLYLPERYNTLSNLQLTRIGNGKYSLVNKGKEGKMFKLELVKAEYVPYHPIPGTSTVDTRCQLSLHTA